jgi:hypothetical protein
MTGRRFNQHHSKLHLTSSHLLGIWTLPPLPTLKIHPMRPPRLMSTLRGTTMGVVTVAIRPPASTHLNWTTGSVMPGRNTTTRIRDALHLRPDTWVCIWRPSTTPTHMAKASCIQRHAPKREPSATGARPYAAHFGEY